MSAMHNNIMAAGSKDRPPMLGPGRYSQWRSRFLRYLDTKSNGEYLRKCIFEGPYTPTNVLIAAVEAAENILPVAAHEEAETIHNMTTENKLYFQAEKEAIFLILTGDGVEFDQNALICADERAALANLIANLTLDTEENKTVLKQLKKANASLTQELKECKTNLDKSSRALGEATSSRDSCLIALQTKQTELEKYTALNDLTSDYKILQTKLNETLGLLALKD
ncbi:hypothetical protein Tco_1439741 [Tanacetum coccineum]